MTIEVEDGTGKANAVSYGSVAAADAYFLARGNETWADAETSSKEAALVRATFGLDSWLRGRWQGTKLTKAQSLAWPRSAVLDEDGFEVATTEIPVQLVHATFETAVIELTTRFLQQTVDSSNAVSSESVGPISVSYSGTAPSITTYPHIEALLRGLAAVGGVQMNFGVSLSQDEIDQLNNPSGLFDYDAYFALIKNY